MARGLVHRRRSTDAATGTDPVEALLAACLERSAADWGAAVERACRARPEHAAALRERFSALVDAGLVQDAAAAGAAEAEARDADRDADREADRDADRDADREVVERLCRERPEVAAALADALGARDVLDELPVASQEGRVVGGRFRVGALLGRGSMGAVHAADDLELGRSVALKFLDARLFADPASERRFLREAESLAALRHVHVVTVHDRGREPDGTLWLAMERLGGASLRTLLDRVTEPGGAPPVDPDAIRAASAALGASLPEPSWLRQAVRWTAELADGLAAAHAASVFHRDVKPSNVFVERDGRAVLLDFGIAARLGDQELTLSRAILGTPSYMPPEQARGPVAPSPALDVYSLGATLYHLLTGQPPFTGDPLQVLVRVQRDAPGAPARLRPGLPRDLVAVIETAMAPAPHRRYPDMAAFAADLRAFLQHRPVTARRTSFLGRLARRVRRHPARAAASVATALALLGFGVALPLWRAELRRSRFSEKSELVATLPALLAFEGAPEERLLDVVRGERRAHIDLLGRILELDPDDLPVRLFRAALLLDEGARPEAARDLAYVAAQRESAFLGAVAERYAAARDGRGVAAVDLDDLGIAPVTPEERFVQGFHELRNRHVAGFAERAEAHLRAAMADYVPARDLRLLALLALGAQKGDATLLDEAIAESLKLEELYGRETARTCAVRGAALVARERYSEAVEPLERSIALRPDRHGPWHNLGVAWRRLGRLDRADECLARAHELRPHFWNTTYTLAQVAKDRGQFERARELASGLAIDDPGEHWKQPYLLANIAVQELCELLRQGGDPAAQERAAAAARGAFDAAEELAPKAFAGRVRTWRGVAEALATGDRAAAVSRMIALAFAEPDDPWLLANITSLLPAEGLDAGTTLRLRVLLAKVARRFAPDDPRVAGYEAEAVTRLQTFLTEKNR